MTSQDNNIYAIDTDSGQFKWIFEVDSPVHTLAVDEETIYAGSSSCEGSFLYGIERATPKCSDNQRSNHPNVAKADKEASGHETGKSGSDTEIDRNKSFCPDCGADLADYGTLNFCPDCGYDL